MKHVNDSAVKVIRSLGDTAKVARMFGIAMPSVSKWKRDGIPKARMMFLRVAHAQKLDGIDLDAATAKEQNADEATQKLGIQTDSHEASSTTSREVSHG